MTRNPILRALFGSRMNALVTLLMLAGFALALPPLFSWASGHAVWEAANRAWSKELRVRASALVNSRLAKDITQADYTSSRQQAHEDAAECRRRAAILNAQITQRMAHPVARELKVQQ